MQNKSMKRENIMQQKSIHVEYSQKQKDILEEIMIQSNMSYSKIMHHMDVCGFKKRFISGPDEGLLEEIFNSIFLLPVEIAYTGDKGAR